MKKMKIFNLLSIIMALLVIMASGHLQGCRRGVRESETVFMGIVTNVQQQVPVSRAQIEIRNTSTGKTYKTTTDQQGRYRILCEAGYYDLTATHANYHEYKRNVVLGKGKNQEDFYMSERVESPASFEGVVTAEDTKKPVENASIQIGNHLARTDAKGRFKFENLPMGTFRAWVTVPGYEAVHETITLLRGKTTREYVLTRLDMSRIDQQARATERSASMALDPTLQGDFRSHTLRFVHPENERHEYRLISENRHRKYLFYDESVDSGEVLFIDDSIYIKFQDKWQAPSQIYTSHRPDDVLTENITTLLYYFNYPDEEIEITDLGPEIMNDYNTHRYHLKYKTGAPPEKQLDISLWVIRDESKPGLHRMLTRFKGRIPLMFLWDNWIEVDTRITHISENNTIEIPDIHKAR